MFDPVISGFLAAIAIGSLIGGVGVVFLVLLMTYEEFKRKKDE